MSSINRFNPSDILQTYDEIPDRRTESSIGDKRYQNSVLKSKELDLSELHRFFEGVGLFILTVGTFGLALFLDRVLDAWEEAFDGRSIIYIKIPMNSIDRRISSSSIPILTDLQIQAQPNFYFNNINEDIRSFMLNSKFFETLRSLEPANYFIQRESPSLDLRSIALAIENQKFNPSVPLIMLYLCYNDKSIHKGEERIMQEIKGIKGVVYIQVEHTKVEGDMEKVKKLVRN